MLATGHVCEWSRLTEGLIHKIASYLHPNEVATSLRLLNHETAQCLKAHNCIQLSQPVTPAPSWSDDERPAYVASQSWPSAAFVAHWGRPQPWRALSLQQRCRLLCLAANSGCAASLEVALAQCGCSLTSEVAVAAALGGSVSACETLLIREGCDCMARLEDVAAEAGHLELLRWLRQARRESKLLRYPPMHLLQKHGHWDFSTPVAACRGGHAHILAWLQTAEAQGLGRAPGAVAAGPLKLAHPIAVPFLTGAAGAGGHVQLLDQLLPRLEPSPTRATCSMLEQVAQGCPLEALQRAYSRVFGGTQPDLNTKLMLVLTAAVSHTPDWEQKLDWILRQQPPFGHADPDDIDFIHADMRICGAGRLPDWLQRLQALRARNVPLPPLSDLAAWAAHMNDAAALTWLLAEQGAAGAVVSDELAHIAATSGHVPILAALQNRGYTFSGRHTRDAALYGKAAAVSWLLAQPLQPSVDDLEAVFNGLAYTGADLTTLQQLHERHGAPIHLETVADHGSMEALEWAVTVVRGHWGEARRGAQQVWYGRQGGTTAWCGALPGRNMAAGGMEGARQLGPWKEHGSWGHGRNMASWGHGRSMAAGGMEGTWQAGGHGRNMAAGGMEGAWPLGAWKEHGTLGGMEGTWHAGGACPCPCEG